MPSFFPQIIEFCTSWHSYRMFCNFVKPKCLFCKYYAFNKSKAIVIKITNLQGLLPVNQIPVM